MNETTKNFIEAFKSITLPKEVIKEYRLYYNEDGDIIRCTMTTEEVFDESFVIVNAEIYNNSHRYKIKDGKPIKVSRRYVPQLSDIGYRVAYGHSALLLKNNENIKDQHYEF